MICVQQINKGRVGGRFGSNRTVIVRTVLALNEEHFSITALPDKNPERFEFELVPQSTENALEKVSVPFLDIHLNKMVSCPALTLPTLTKVASALHFEPDLVVLNPTKPSDTNEIRVQVTTSVPLEFERLECYPNRDISLVSWDGIDLVFLIRKPNSSSDVHTVNIAMRDTNNRLHRGLLTILN